MEEDASGVCVEPRSRGAPMVRLWSPQGETRKWVRRERVTDYTGRSGSQTKRRLRLHVSWGL